MKSLTGNFNRLSVKQIRTYAVVFMFTSISYSVQATVSGEELSSEPATQTAYETGMNEEVFMENWMTIPFEAGTFDESANEEELVLEEWMTSPFNSIADEWMPRENSICGPMP